MSKPMRSLFKTLLVMLLWGSLYPVVKLGFTACGVSATGDILMFAGVRFAISGGIICLWQLMTDRKSFATVRVSLVPVLASGFFAIVLHYSFNYLGLKLTDSSKTALLKQIGTLLYVCFSFLFFKEDRLTARKLIGAVLGFVGVLSMSFDQGSLRFQRGDLLILAASFCTVFSNVISKKALKRVNPVSMTGVSHLAGGVVLLAAGLLLGGHMQIASWRAVFILIYISFATILSYCLWFSVVRDGQLSRLFIIKFAEPVFACLFGALLLHENVLQLQYLVAFLLISIGISVSN